MNTPELDPTTRIDMLCADLTDIQLWLRDWHPSETFGLVVDYYHHQKCRKEIAYVVILHTDQEKRRALREIATLALERLGWRINPDGGGDVIDARPYPSDDISGHARLRAIARVTEAFKRAKQQH